MKKQKYTVTFIEGESLVIYADTAIRAFFLASARKIESGLPYGVDSIYENDTKRFFVSKKENMQNLLIEVLHDHPTTNKIRPRA